tara:strand:- start:238 stop:819 length:582 start_codon:yes stop_codon:yes gene_type:complete
MIAEALLSNCLALAGCTVLLACVFVTVSRICSLLDDSIDGDEALWQSQAHVHEAYRDTPPDAAPAKTAAYACLAANDRSPPLSQVLSDQSLHIQGRRSEHQDPAHCSASVRAGGNKTPKSRRPRRDDASAPNALAHAQGAGSSHLISSVYGLQGQANHRGASSGKVPALSSGSKFYAHVLRTQAGAQTRTDAD